MEHLRDHFTSLMRRRDGNKNLRDEDRGELDVLIASARRLATRPTEGEMRHLDVRCRRTSGATAKDTVLDSRLQVLCLGERNRASVNRHFLAVNQKSFMTTSHLIN